MSKNCLYIAYGSNLNLPQMGMRCPTAEVVGASEIKNYELLFRGGRRGAAGTGVQTCAAPTAADRHRRGPHQRQAVAAGLDAGALLDRKSVV